MANSSTWPLGFGRGDWVSDRYQVEFFLGEGGMGCVFQAHDLHLNRKVALKFVKNLSSESGRHLLREARLQALVEHESICKVFEIGSDRGHTYITMQCLQGKPLQCFIKTLPLEAKLALMRDVAQAVHAAHGHGLIHRDLKPSNILVCENINGTLKPYVMDFGLARRLEEAHSTRTGMLQGTPLFMAPEQVRGNPKEIDRRTDVYGLGATLHYLLSGHPPHEGPNQAAVWVAILEREVPSIRKRLPSLPKDVAAIVATALAGEADRRYGSARAMADDLNRFLHGEPIVANPPSYWDLLRHGLRRHRWWVRTGLISLIAVLVVLGWGINQRRALAVRAEIANDFVQRTEEVEALHRYYTMLPLHEIRDERAYLRGQMSAIEDQMLFLGSPAVGPGHYALGRGLWALRQFDESLSHLRQAWTAGYREPQVIFALGQVMNALYQRELARIETLPDKDQRRLARETAVRDFCDPARDYLNQIDAIETAHNLESKVLLALFDDQPQVALSILDRLFRQQPWYYEALTLQGQVLTRLGDGCRDGGDVVGAKAHYDAAHAKLLLAANIGRSDGENYLALASLHLAYAIMANLDPEVTSEASIVAGRISCERALTIDPEKPDGFWLLSIFASLKAEAQLQQGMDPSNAWQTSLQYAQQCLALDPERPLVYNSMGMVHQVMGRYAWGQGKDPIIHFNKAIEALQVGLRFHPNLAALHNNLGLALLYRTQVSGDIWNEDHEDLRGAIDHLQIAINHLPERVSTVLNLGAAHWMIAEAQVTSGQNPAEAICRANIAFDHVLTINPNHGIAHLNKGNAIQMMATFELEAHRGQARHFFTALNHFGRAKTSLPDLAEVDNAMAVGHLNLAKLAWINGRSPDAHLAMAMVAANRGLDARPSWDFALFNLGLAHWLDARYRSVQGRLAEPSLTIGRELMRETIRINPQFADAWVVLGDLSWLPTRRSSAEDSHTEDVFNQAESHYRQALEIDSGNAFGHDGLGRLALQRSRDEALSRANRLTHLGNAQAALEVAILSQPNQSDFFQSLGLVHLERARLSPTSQQEVRPWVETGLAFAKERLANQPQDRWNLWLEAEFRLLMSLGLANGHDREKAWTQAKRDIQAVWRQNPNLAHQVKWLSGLQRASDGGGIQITNTQGVSYDDDHPRH